MPSATTTRDDITLTCDIARVEDSIVFTYSVANGGGADICVMDAEPTVDPLTQRPGADPAAATLWRGADGYAQVLKGVASLPPGVEPETRIMPYGVLVPPGESVSRRLAERMPLAEHSPYAPVGHLREYRLMPIEGVALAVDVLPLGGPAVAVPAREIGGGYRRVVADESVVLFRRLACGFRARGLFMLVRTDAYPRPD